MNIETLLSARAAATPPFYVMELLARASQWEKTHGPSISMVVGEPDFPAPPAVVAAAQAALRDGRIHYTHALGMPTLRQAIAADYMRRDGIAIDPARVAVTAGGSGALLLAMAALLNPGDEVLMTDPGYPCNRQFVSAAAGVPRMIAVDASTNFQPTAEQVRAAWGPKTKALLVASPANPTGTLLSMQQAASLADTVRGLGGVLIVDEIYQRLVFEGHPPSLLALGDDLITINSFSKTYSMTGWRLGWLIAPPVMMTAVERLAQNLFISPASVAQQAAIAAFDPDSLQVAEHYRQQFVAHGAYLLPELRRLGFKIPVQPQGAFYAYCDVADLTDDSYRFCMALCDAAGVLMTPGRDFGDHQSSRFLRVSFTKPLEMLAEGVRRVEHFLKEQA
jgi:aspartate/methionine/tyrosine aminotransferase